MVMEPLVEDWAPLTQVIMPASRDDLISVNAVLQPTPCMPGSVLAPLSWHKTPFPGMVVARLIYETGQAMLYMANNKIVHRDFCTNNLMVSCDALDALVAGCTSGTFARARQQYLAAKWREQAQQQQQQQQQQQEEAAGDMHSPEAAEKAQVVAPSRRRNHAQQPFTSQQQEEPTLAASGAGAASTAGAADSQQQQALAAGGSSAQAQGTKESSRQQQQRQGQAVEREAAASSDAAEWEVVPLEPATSAADMQQLLRAGVLQQAASKAAEAAQQQTEVLVSICSTAMMHTSCRLCCLQRVQQSPCATGHCTTHRMSMPGNVCH
jgi:hypothetical protein